MVAVHYACFYNASAVLTKTKDLLSATQAYEGSPSGTYCCTFKVHNTLYELSRGLHVYGRPSECMDR